MAEDASKEILKTEEKKAEVWAKKPEVWKLDDGKGVPPEPVLPFYFSWPFFWFPYVTNDISARTVGAQVGDDDEDDDDGDDDDEDRDGMLMINNDCDGGSHAMRYAWNLMELDYCEM
mmetsp:Transcript_19509/g.36724  ORF Transcript_19509/g.36724 Transcript_19509/m.36724 type:complete len:117 (+) Transcript_19509:75-425(+)